MKHKLIAIDADLWVYRIGYLCQDEVDFGDGPSMVADGRQAIDHLKSELKEVRRHLGAADIVICLSDTNHNFRKDVLPSYKANRGDGSRRPVLFSFIRQWFFENCDVECWDSLEADDVLGILATRDGATMVSIDKDLKTIPGQLVNPMRKWREETITERAADQWFLTQTLIGDSTDNYKGLPGVGPVTAREILKEGTWREVVDAFESKGYTEADALVQARVARILRDTDYPNNTVKLWSPA